jgi:hypothetical protein
MTGWRKRTIMEMARDVKMPYDFVTGEPLYIEKLEAFADLIRADERKKTWTQKCWTEYERSIAAEAVLAEREAIAKEELIQPKREWVSLSDEEIEDCIDMSIQKTCRAVEAKLRSKNNAT